ncbi:hypothetical protein SAMN02745126_05964 [Enhydrobacter aerosaccus]|uniref:Phytanoyl-CoA dioxygenase (PhyH) n=1 Tax=Enhydrobacter aerosaccus TaxID=225324 RepID=A0A1T4TBH1_9HYPH|nr:hypothetical protein [Enhydrobacter aerosaccus]SKA37824.1 hypothetical protein SAMN02745126_05964 [Enhydrobacter aerosaccus]
MVADTDLLRRALDAVRAQIPQDQWDSFAEAIVRDRQGFDADLRGDVPADNFRHLLPSLKESSWTKLPMAFQGVPEIKDYLLRLPVHKGPHIYANDGIQMPLEAARAQFPIVGYRSDQLLRAPGLLDQLNDPRLIDLIESYMGCVPTLYSVNCWWSFPAEKPELFYSQYYHRDTDDWRFLTLFIYLTDVDAQGGPHQIIPGSHSAAGMAALARKNSWFRPGDISKTFVNAMGEQFAAETERRFGAHAIELTGPAGTMLLVNTLSLHRGLMPTKSPRLLLWARYGLGRTCISADQEHGPLARRQVQVRMPATPRNRYINRLMVDFDIGPQS